MLKHRTYHAGNHGDIKLEDSNNTTVMRITYDNYPCGILTVGTDEFDLISHIHN